MNKKSKQKAYRYGFWAEHIAVCYLRLKGCQILARRYRTPVGEIDIIARRGNLLLMAEVKARKDTSAEEVLSQHQIERITRAASLFIAKKPKFATFSLRFDLLVIRPWRWPTHVKNAWQNEEKF